MHLISNIRNIKTMWEILKRGEEIEKGKIWTYYIFIHTKTQKYYAWAHFGKGLPKDIFQPKENNTRRKVWDIRSNGKQNGKIRNSLKLMIYYKVLCLQNMPDMTDPLYKWSHSGCECMHKTCTQEPRQQKCQHV